MPGEPALSATLSPLMVAPSSSRSVLSSHHTCRVIIGPTDADFISVIVDAKTTVGQLKAEAVRALLSRDSRSVPLSPRSRQQEAEEEKEIQPADSLQHEADHFMLVKRADPRSAALSEAALASSPSLAFMPQMNPGLLNTSSPFRTLQQTQQAQLLASLQTASAGAGSLSPPSRPPPSRPQPPDRTAPRAPGSLASTAVGLPFSGMSQSFNTSDAMSPVPLLQAAGGGASPLFPLSLLGQTVVRLEESDAVVGLHDEPDCELRLERLTDDIHIRLELDDEQTGAGAAVTDSGGQQQQSAEPPDASESELLDATAAESASGLNVAASSAQPPSSASSGIGGSVFSFPLPASSQLTASSLSAPLTERASELSAGLDICIMSIHGAYLQSPARDSLRLSCLDNWTTFTLLDSAALDDSGSPFRYLRTEMGQFLAADDAGSLWLDDVDAPAQQEEEKQQDGAGAGGPRGLLRPCHRWLIRKGQCQSLLSMSGLYLTLCDDGEVLLTPVRYEESCLHLCFAVVQGGLSKRADSGLLGLRRWGRRWFVLSGSTLSFFDQQADIYDRDNNPALASKAAAAASSSSVYSTAGILSINVHPQPSCRFDVEFVNGRVLQVRADSEAERERWVRALRNGKVGKQMDAKAKQIRKKQRERTVRAKQRQQRQDGILQAAAAAAGDRYDPLQTADSASVSAAPLSPSDTAGKASLKPLSSEALQDEVPAASSPASPALRIDVTKEQLGQPAGGRQTAAAAVSGSGAAAARGSAHAAHTPSVSATPDLSLYYERPQSPTDFSPRNELLPAAVSGKELPRAISDGSSSRSSHSPPLSRDAAAGHSGSGAASPRTLRPRRSLSLT